jgi:hypothetical protein
MASLKTITGFKSKLAGGGARANLFEISIPTFPTVVSGWDNETFTFLCKGGPIPAANVNPVDVSFRGRVLKVAGDRTYDPWSITVINDENFKIRTAFEAWSNAINRMESGTGLTKPDSYMANVAYVHQLGRGYDTGIESSTISNLANNATVNPIRTYLIHNIWPTNVSPIDLNWDSTDQIQTFTVEFQMTHWTAGDASDITDQVKTPIS